MDSPWKVSSLDMSLLGDGGNLSCETLGDKGMVGDMDVLEGQCLDRECVYHPCDYFGVSHC